MPSLKEARARADRKVLQMMKKYPGNLTIWDALSLSKELREALITILNETEIYEVHAAEYRELAY